MNDHAASDGSGSDLEGSCTDLRTNILDESRHLLVAQGYDNLSMRKIAARIGYSATTIYLHFENKESLFHALIEEGMDRMYSVLKEVEQSEQRPIERLAALCRSYVEFGLENPEYYEVMFVMKPVLRHRFPQDKFRRARRNLDLFTEAIRENSSRARNAVVGNVAVTATRIWASLHGVVSLIIARRIDARVDEAAVIESMIQSILHSVGLGAHELASTTQ